MTFDFVSALELYEVGLSIAELDELCTRAGVDLETAVRVIAVYRQIMKKKAREKHSHAKMPSWVARVVRA